MAERNVRKDLSRRDALMTVMNLTHARNTVAWPGVVKAEAV